MADLNCPFCTETRPTLSRLQTHVDYRHNADVPAARTAVAVDLNRAGDEISDLKAKADALVTRLEALDRAHMEPAAVRRATLNEVWAALMSAGDIAGARIVTRMAVRSDGGRS